MFEIKGQEFVDPHLRIRSDCVEKPGARLFLDPSIFKRQFCIKRREAGKTARVVSAGGLASST